MVIANRSYDQDMARPVSLGTTRCEHVIIFYVLHYLQGWTIVTRVTDYFS